MENAINLRELIEILLKGKWIIIVITFIAILLGGVFSFYTYNPKYEAKTVLAVEKMNIPVKQSESLNELVSNFLRATDINVRSYVSLVKSDTILTEVMNKLTAKGQQISLGALSSKINAVAITDTNLLEIKVKDTDRRTAAEIANLLAEELVESVSIVNNENISKNLASLENRVKEERVNIEKNEAEIKKFLQQPDSVVKMEAELDMALQLLSDFQAREINLQVETEKVSTLIEAIENQLSDIPIKIEFNNQDITHEGLNPVYIELKNKLETNKALLVQQRTEEASIQEKIATLSKTIDKLQSKIADKMSNLEQLQFNADVTKEKYQLFNYKLTEAQYLGIMENNEAQLRIISIANEPQTPITLNKELNIVIAACLGSMLGVFVVLLRYCWVNSAENIQA